MTYNVEQKPLTQSSQTSESAPSEGTVSLEKKPFFGPVVITIISCVILTLFAVATNRNSALIKHVYDEDQEDMDFIKNLRVGPEPFELTGKQYARSNCAILYGSDYHVFPNTKAYKICSDDQLYLYNLNKKGFSKKGKNHGVSYIETGEHASVVLYDEDNFEGNTYQIQPNSQVNLWDVKVQYHASESWNDRAKSVGIFARMGGSAFLVHGKQVPGDYCAILYGSDPTINRQTRGVEICGEYGAGKKFTFSHHDLLKKDINVDKISKGISFILTGKKVRNLKAYVGSDFSGESIEVSGRSSKALNYVKIPGSQDHFADNVKAFELYI